MSIMKKNKLFNVIMVLLCVVAIIINHYFENMKVLGITSILSIAVLAIMKEKLINKN